LTFQKIGIVFCNCVYPTANISGESNINIRKDNTKQDLEYKCAKSVWTKYKNRLNLKVIMYFLLHVFMSEKKADLIRSGFDEV